MAVSAFSSLSWNSSSLLQNCRAFTSVLDNMLSRGIIETIPPPPPDQEGRHFYSCIFSGSRKRRFLETNPDLSFLSLFLKVPTFKMSLQTFLLIPLYSFMVILNLKDAYHHIPARAQFKSLRFCAVRFHCQFSRTLWLIHCSKGIYKVSCPNHGLSQTTGSSHFFLFGLSYLCRLFLYMSGVFKLW